MAFPSTGGSHQMDCAAAWNRARNYARTVKDATQTVRTASQSGVLTSAQVLNLATLLADMKAEFNACSAVVGIQAYAQTQINDASINVTNEFNTMLAAMDSVVAWIVNNFPKDGNGFLLSHTFHAGNNGRTTARVFSAVETEPLRTVLDALLAAIE